MRAVFGALLVMALVRPSPAFTVEQLSLEFDARLLTEQEKRFLQVGLAFDTYYNGMIDGAWGPGSQRALERSALANGGSAIVTNADAGLAAIEAYSSLEAKGWERQYDAALDMSFLVPTAALEVGGPSDIFVNLNVTGRSIAYSLAVSDGTLGESFHLFTEDQAVGEVYTVRRPLVWITSARTRDARSLYTRSDYRNGLWSTVMVSALDRDAGLLRPLPAVLLRGMRPPSEFRPGCWKAGSTRLR